MDAAKSSGPRACRACAASKAKCIFLPESSILNGKCRRCNRLNKECTMQTPAPRKSKPQKGKRMAELEDKLDSLASLVISSRQAPPPEDGASALLEPASSSTARQISSPTWPSPPQSSLPPGSVEKEVNLIGTLRDPEIHLDLFRSRMTNQFPFVVVPPAMTAHDLGQSRPLLLKTIIMVTSFVDRASQAVLASEIMDHLSLNMLKKAEKNMDLLQSILVFVAWIQNHIHIARRTSLLLHLALSLVADMGLSNEPNMLARYDQMQHGFKLFPNERPKLDRRTLEERRAFLGLMYLTSNVSVNVIYIDGTRFNKYTLNCINAIEESAQYPSDRHLVQFMRLQQIFEEIALTLSRTDLDSSFTSYGAVLGYIMSLQSRLEDFRSRLPSDLKNDVFLLMHYYHVLCFLTKTALFTPIPSRGATLQACLTSTQSFLQLLLSVPWENYWQFTYPTWLQNSYTLNLLDRLSHLESPDWDAMHARSIVDLSAVLRGLLARFEEMQAYLRRKTQPDAGPGLLDKVIPTYRRHLEEFQRKRALLMPTDVGPPLPAIGMPFQSDVDNMADVMFTDLDEAFWQEMTVDWNLGQGLEAPVGSYILPQ